MNTPVKIAGIVTAGLVVLGTIGMLMPSEDQPAKSAAVAKVAPVVKQAPPALTAEQAAAIKRDAKRTEARAERAERKAKRAERAAKARRKAERERREQDASSGNRLPDVTGMDHQLAQDTLQAAGWYALDEKDCSGQERMLVWDRNWTVVSQSPKAGSKVSEDRTITLCSIKDGE